MSPSSKENRPSEKANAQLDLATWSLEVSRTLGTIAASQADLTERVGRVKLCIDKVLSRLEDYDGRIQGLERFQKSRVWLERAVSVAALTIVMGYLAREYLGM